MRLVFVALLTLSTYGFSAPRYSCELKTRPHLMQPFEIQGKDFDGDRPIEIRTDRVILKFRTVLLEGKETLALWLGTPTKDRSSVTMAQPGQSLVYLNFLNGDEFSIAQCKISQPK